MICNSIPLPPQPNELPEKTLMNFAIDQSNVHGRQLIEAFLSNMSTSEYHIQLKKELSELDIINNMEIIPNIVNIYSRTHTHNAGNIGKNKVTGETIDKKESHFLLIDGIDVIIQNKSANDNEELIDLIDDLGGIGIDSKLETKNVKIKISISPNFTYTKHPESLNISDIYIIGGKTTVKIEIKVDENDGYYLLEENLSQKSEINPDKSNNQNEHLRKLYLNLIDSVINKGKEISDLIPDLIGEAIKKYTDGERSIEASIMDTSGSIKELHTF